MEKATREAKEQTSWTQPNQEFEDALKLFIERILASNEFVSELEAFVAKVLLPGRINSLTQTLLKCTAPGVPDTYQGSEIWDLHLVDPDNRGPIDYESRKAMLAELEAGMSVEEIMSRMDSGMPKLWVLYKALHLRREKPEWFGTEAAYSPLPVEGPKTGASDRIFPWRFSCGPCSAMECQARWRVWIDDCRAAAGNMDQHFHRGKSEGRENARCNSCFADFR